MTKNILKYLVIAALPMLLVACSHVDLDELAAVIQIDYQNAIDREYNLYASTGVFDQLDHDTRPIIKDLKVHHIISDMYVGIATIDIAGEQQIKPIYISVKEDKISWEVPEHDMNLSK